MQILNRSSLKLAQPWVIATVVVMLGGCQSETATAEEAPASDIERASYLLGYQQARNLQQQTQGVVDIEMFARGVAALAAGEESVVSDAERVHLIAALQEAVSAQASAAGDEARAAGDAYRAEQANKEGMQTLPSGLMYEVLTEGTGAKPTAADTVVTHYHGTLIDGTVFDSSVDRGTPATFPVGRVIRGWTEALQLMSVGSKWRLVIPPELAYGENGAGGDIPPHATLVFEVELLEIKQQ